MQMHAALPWLCVLKQMDLPQMAILKALVTSCSSFLICTRVKGWPTHAIG